MYQPKTDSDVQVRIRNTRDGIVFEMPESGDIEQVVEQIRYAVSVHAKARLRQTAVIVDFCDRSPDGLEAKQIEQTLASAGVGVRRVTASRPGLRPEPRPIPNRPNKIISRPDQLLMSRELDQDRVARYIRGSVRSGEVKITDGDLVMLGDVEFDASVHAGGDVIVWGSLFGSVRAGANPATNDATICALHFQPTQIQIGKMVATPSNVDVFDTSAPQEAYRDGNSIIVKPWRTSDDRS